MDASDKNVNAHFRHHPAEYVRCRSEENGSSTASTMGEDQSSKDTGQSFRDQRSEATSQDVSSRPQTDCYGSEGGMGED
jgi:hypothetical protein